MPQIWSGRIHIKGALVECYQGMWCFACDHGMVIFLYQYFTMLLLQGSLLCEAIEAKAEESSKVLIACCSARDVNSLNSFKDTWVCDRIGKA